MKFTELTINQQIALIEAIRNETQISSVAIEKDWWVTAVLRALFSLPYAKHLSFKGGTSLPVRAFISIENSNTSQPNLRRRFTLNH